MGVVVRMEMPNSCPCELAGGYDIPLPCFAGHGIPKRCKEFDECVEKGTKPDWCPIICQLPEGHGDLIDRDKTFHAAQPMGCTDEQWAETTLGRVVMEAWAIVPAEAERSEP